MLGAANDRRTTACGVQGRFGDRGNAYGAPCSASIGADKRKFESRNSLPQAMVERPSAEVAVIVPVYNAGAYLLEAIRSLMNQTSLAGIAPRLPEFEIIVVDDASTDTKCHDNIT